MTRTGVGLRRAEAGSGAFRDNDQSISWVVEEWERVV